MDIETVKLYLRIDNDEEDGLLEMMLETAREYVVDAVGKCDETKSKVRLLLLNIISDIYENRSLMEEKSIKKLRHSVQSIIFQLQVEEMSS